MTWRNERPAKRVATVGRLDGKGKRMKNLNYPPALTRPWQDRLVQRLVNQGVLTTPARRTAFAQVARHLFVSHYYEQQGTTLTWLLREAPDPATPADQLARWLAVIYSDRALVTSLDEEQQPASSSSQPSVMARMLDVLMVEPGMRVLEIGTGTGYNAALLAALTGDPGLVTTIEAQPDLALQADTVLRAVVGPGLCVGLGDGWEGWKERAPYERIVATASVVTVPDAWIAQLAPGGQLVMDLGGQLAGGLLQADKNATGEHISGAFLPVSNVRFMALHSQHALSAAALRRHFRRHATREPTQVVSLPSTSPLPALLREPDFLFYLQWHLPQAALQWWGRETPERLVPALLDPPTDTLLTFKEEDEAIAGARWFATVSGPGPLWHRVRLAAASFLRLGKPTPAAYRLLITSQGSHTEKRLVIASPGEESLTADSSLALL